MKDLIDMSETVWRKQNRRDFEVVKLGGSLLEVPDLKLRLERWVDSTPKKYRLWIVGGGRVVDDLREKWSEGNLESAEAHWKAISTMDDHGRMVAGWFGWPVVKMADQWLSSVRQIASDSQLDDLDAGPLNVCVLVHDWMRENQKLLPIGWDVTSDSIALAIALNAHATTLKLLKSTEAETQDVNTLVENGYLDSHFATLAASVDPDLLPEMLGVNFRSGNQTTLSL